MGTIRRAQKLALKAQKLSLSSLGSELSNSCSALYSRLTEGTQSNHQPVHYNPDQTEAVSLHTQRGIEFFEKYGAFVKERALIEEEYATKLRNLAKKNLGKKKDDEAKGFTYINTFNTMLHELESLAGQHEVIADRLRKDIHPGVTQKALNLRQVRKSHLQDLQSLNVVLARTVENMEKAQKQYAKVFKEAEAAHIKYLKNDKNMDLSRAEVEKSKNAAIAKCHMCEEAKQGYAHALEIANRTKHEYYEVKLPALLMAMKAADIERINETKLAMQKTIEAETSVVKIIQACYDEMMKGVISTNPDFDTQVVVDQNVSGYPIPEDYGFEDLGDPANTVGGGGDGSDSVSIKKGTMGSQKNGTTGKAIGRRQSMHQKLFGGSGEKPSKTNGNTGDYGNLPPQQRCRKIQQKLEELDNEHSKLANSLAGVEKMRDVYTQNNKLGNPKDVEPKIAEYKSHIAKVQTEVSKYRSLLDQIQVEMKNASIHSGDSLKFYNAGSNTSSPRVSSSGISSAANTNRTSYSEESVSSEGSSGFASKKTLPSNPGTNGFVKQAPIALKEASPPRPNLPSQQHETNGNYEEFDLPALGTCKALYPFEGGNDGTTVTMREGDEMLLLEKDEALFQEIKGRQEDFMRAFNAGDTAKAAEIYHPDGYFMPNGHHPVKGRAGIEEYFKADMKDGVATAQIITEEVNGCGCENFAYERGSYHLNGSKGTESGTYLQVWKKDNGVWFVHSDCFNVTKAASL
ncbi:hypothetical protein FO519_003499 [Halicephalobus sp. NKZ332]|nr:hypothetical protein FO519_003499 [Halicephalobus sp. NKZ332]